MTQLALQNHGFLDEKDLVPLLDLTLLERDAPDDALYKLCERANEHQVAAVCVLPEHVEVVRPLTHVACATVLNFPEGTGSDKAVLQLLDNLLAKSAVDEIDYVFQWRAWLSGDTQKPLSQLQEVGCRCREAGVLLKVILETGAFSSLDTLHALACKVLDAQCDFLKTSTGKLAAGASFEAVFTLLEALAVTEAPSGIKVSGGVREPLDALRFARLAAWKAGKAPSSSWFRIGASSLLDAILAQP